MQGVVNAKPAESRLHLAKPRPLNRKEEVI